MKTLSYTESRASYAQVLDDVVNNREETIITRAGDHARMIFTGDVQQIDSPYLDSRSNGLAYMIERMRGEDCFAHVNLIHGERSHLSDLAARKL